MVAVFFFLRKNASHAATVYERSLTKSCIKYGLFFFHKEDFEQSASMVAVFFPCENASHALHQKDTS